MNLKTTKGSRRWKLIASAALLGVALLATTCDETGATTDEARTVDLEGATSALVKVTMGAGELTVDGGVDELGRLMQADLTYNVDDWAPDIYYAVTGDHGELTVDQLGRNLSRVNGDHVNGA